MMLVRVMDFPLCYPYFLRPYLLWQQQRPFLFFARLRFSQLLLRHHPHHHRHYLHVRN